MRTPRATVLPALGALAALGLVASACSSGPSSPGIASLGAAGSDTTAATAPPASNAQQAYADAVNYAGCMRTHGISNMPDPTSKGDFLTDRGLLNGVHVDANSAAFTRADKECSHLLPNGGVPTAGQRQQAITKVLKFVACIRKHGFPDMPDPVTTGGNIALRLPSGAGPNSPQWLSATKACQAYQPEP